MSEPSWGPSNERPGADAGWRVLFAFGSPWPRAAQAGRYGRFTRDVYED